MKARRQASCRQAWRRSPAVLPASGDAADEVMWRVLSERNGEAKAVAAKFARCEWGVHRVSAAFNEAADARKA